MNFLTDFTLRDVISWFIPPEKTEKRPNYGKFGWNYSSFVVMLIWSLTKLYIAIIPLLRACGVVR